MKSEAVKNFETIIILLLLVGIPVALLLWALLIGKKQHERHMKVVNGVKATSKIDHEFFVVETGSGRYSALFDDTSRRLSLIHEEKLYQTSYGKLAEVGWSWNVNRKGRRTDYLYFEINDPHNPLVKIPCKPAFAERWQAKVRAIMAA